MMLSMTAFSRQQADREWGSLTWELRSINHRYLETSVRLPESFRGLENVIRDTVRKKLNRGKIECQLRFQALETSQSDLQLNKEVIAKLVRANSEINKITDLDNQLTSVEILRWPGVVADQGSDADTIEKEALDLFIAALDDLVSSRAREGEALKGMLNQRIVSRDRCLYSGKNA